MIITIKGEGAEDFAEALAHHFHVIQVPIKEIIVGGEAVVECEERIGGPGSCSEFEAGLAANAEASMQWSIAQAAQELQCAEALAENYRLRVALAGLIGQIDLFCAANGEADFETGAAKRLLRRKTKC